MPRRLIRFALCFALLVGALGAARWVRHRWRHPFRAPLEAPLLFADDFEGAARNPITRGRLDPLKWQVQGPDQILQRTQWGRSPDLRRDADGTSFARLSLATHNPNPDKAGRFHLSTQITSLDRWNLDSGLEYEARIRADHLPPGLILGFFAYGDAGAWRHTYQKTEADFELLTVQGGDKIWTHIWDNWNPLRAGENDGSMHGSEGANWNDGSWNLFKIRWYPDHTEWICNDILIRDERAVRPGSPMGVWFNLWAPNPDWLDAYDPAVKAAPRAATSQSYFYDVDYVRVRRIPASQNTGAAPSSPGSGEGLQASYFPTPDLSGRAVVRLDPRVDFGWGRYAPDSRLPADGFSARWEGFVVARAAETTTFSVKSRNGVRLWVGGKLLIDGWNTLAPRSRSGSIALPAEKQVPIRLEIFNRVGDASASLWWSSASVPPEIVPQSQLHLAQRPAQPRLWPDSRILARPQNIEIRSATPGATIRYTLDGRAPTRSSRILLRGARLRISYTTLVRAGAFLENQVPSESARAFYVLDDTTPPLVTIQAPDFAAAGIPAITGQVSDSGSGVARLDLVIKRLSDGARWKQGAWVRQEWGIGAVIRDEKWSVSAGLPAPKDLQPGRYELKAVAYDLAGNIRGAAQSISISALQAVRPKTRL